MKWATILVSFLCVGCTITVTPLPTKRHVHRFVSNRTRAAIKPNFVIVDSGWLNNYKQMEKSKNYEIHDDGNIKSVKGKFHVPKSVVNHHDDMIKAKPTP